MTQESITMAFKSNNASTANSGAIHNQHAGSKHDVRMCRPPPDKRMHKREGVMCKLWKRASGMAKERMLHLPKIQGGNQLQTN